MATKNFRLRADELKPIATGHGACFASDRITVDGKLVGYMYREAADNENDSGWRFLAGDETDEYMNESSNLGLYDVNTIANYDPSIVEFLDAAANSAFARNPGTSKLTPVKFQPPSDH